MTGGRTAGHLVKLYPDEKARLTALAQKNGVTLSDAFRRGADMYLTDGHAYDAALAAAAAEDDELLGELRSLAGRIDSRIRRGS